MGREFFRILITLIPKHEIHLAYFLGWHHPQVPWNYPKAPLKQGLPRLPSKRRIMSVSNGVRPYCTGILVWQIPHHHRRLSSRFLHLERLVDLTEFSSPAAGSPRLKSPRFSLSADHSARRRLTMTFSSNTMPQPSSVPSTPSKHTLPSTPTKRFLNSPKVHTIIVLDNSVIFYNSGNTKSYRTVGCSITPIICFTPQKTPVRKTPMKGGPKIFT